MAITPSGTLYFVWTLCESGGAEVHRIGPELESCRDIRGPQWQWMTTGVACFGEQAWVGGWRGLLRMDSGALEAPAPTARGPELSYIGDRSHGASAASTSETDQWFCEAMDVDGTGTVWALSFGDLRAVAQPAPAGAPWWCYSRVVAGQIACLCADRQAGVWLYSHQHDDGVRLRRYLLKDNAADPANGGIVEARSVPGLPAVADPCMATGPQDTVFVAGRTGDGGVLASWDGTSVTVTRVPPDLLRGCLVTTLTAGNDGEVYLATDGAGVLTYDGTWGVHPITESLPTLAETGLRPVDDIIVTADGTLYVACRHLLAVWRPD